MELQLCRSGNRSNEVEPGIATVAPRYRIGHLHTEHRPISGRGTCAAPARTAPATAPGTAARRPRQPRRRWGRRRGAPLPTSPRTGPYGAGSGRSARRGRGRGPPTRSPRSESGSTLATVGEGTDGGETGIPAKAGEIDTGSQRAKTCQPRLIQLGACMQGRPGTR